MRDLVAIKNLRNKTGVGVKACKEALVESKGDQEKAIEFLRKRGILKAKQRADSMTSNGLIMSYVHNGRIGVLVELACETDFVARNKDFQNLAKELCLHIAASAPIYVSKDDVPDEVLAKERAIIKGMGKGKGKPKEVVEKIIEGQLKKFYEEACLLEQIYVRDNEKSIQDLINEALASFGEKIVIRRFIRVALGADINVQSLNINC